MTKSLRNPPTFYGAEWANNQYSFIFVSPRIKFNKAHSTLEKGYSLIFVYFPIYMLGFWGIFSYLSFKVTINELWRYFGTQRHNGCQWLSATIGPPLWTLIKHWFDSHEVCPLSQTLKATQKIKLSNHAPVPKRYFGISLHTWVYVVDFFCFTSLQYVE